MRSAELIIAGKREGSSTAAKDTLGHADLPTFRGGFTYTFRAFPQAPAGAVAAIDENRRGGVPTVGIGHWPVSVILSGLAQGRRAADLVREFPGLTEQDILGALALSAWVMREPRLDWKTLDIGNALGIESEWETWERASDQSFNWVESYSE
jgi:uncharacterized protein (DUF433 family)